jgi:hypothetical protein
MALKGFKNFLTQNGSPLSAANTSDLQDELEARETNKNIFPLEVFNDEAKPFIEALNFHYDIPRSFIGLSLLCAYSTAIGTAYAVSPNGTTLIYLPVWGCLAGISSSGKSLAMDMVFQPLAKIQAEFDQDYLEKAKGLSAEKIARLQIDTVLYRDAHIPTLIRYVMPDNHKGVSKFSDELLEWINGLNSMSKKEGTDEQFWISSWNCKGYSAIRSGKDKISIPRPFVNIVGGVQPTVLHKMFAKDRDTTGFIFRLLFAVPEVIKIAEPESDYSLPLEYIESHEEIIRALYFELPVEDPFENPKKCILSKEANKLHQEWTKMMIGKINRMESIRDKEIHSGILGKIKEYALRFSAILHLVDKAYRQNKSDDPTFYFSADERITSGVMERALKLADYFYQSAVDCYNTVEQDLIAPADVVQAAVMFKGGHPMKKIANILYHDDSKKSEMKIRRNIKKWIRDYPKLFNANTK